MRLAFGAAGLSRLRAAGAALVLLVLATAPFERWYLTRRSNAMQEQIIDLRRAASARFPEGWQADSVAVAEVASLEVQRARVRHRLVSQWTFEGWTVRLLIVGAGLVLVSLLGERGEGSGTRR